MLKKDESIKHIEEWSKKHEAQVQENDMPTDELRNGIKELKEEEQIECLQRRYDEEKTLRP